MFKSILALIPSERPVRPVVDGSVVLAMTCHAHVNALAIGYEFHQYSDGRNNRPGDRNDLSGKPATRYRARRNRNERF